MKKIESLKEFYKACSEKGTVFVTKHYNKDEERFIIAKYKEDREIEIFNVKDKTFKLVSFKTISKQTDITFNIRTGILYKVLNMEEKIKQLEILITEFKDSNPELESQADELYDNLLTEILSGDHTEPSYEDCVKQFDKLKLDKLKDKIFIVTYQGGIYDSTWEKEPDANTRRRELERDLGLSGAMDTRVSVISTKLK